MVGGKDSHYFQDLDHYPLEMKIHPGDKYLVFPQWQKILLPAFQK